MHVKILGDYRIEQRVELKNQKMKSFLEQYFLFFCFFLKMLQDRQIDDHRDE